MPRKPDPHANASKTDPSADRELLDRIRGGSEADFKILYDRYFQRVYSFAYARLRNRADAEEVVQETFTAVFRSVDGYRGESSLLSWIYGITKNMVSSHVRRAKAHDMRVQRAEQELQRPDSALDASTPEEQLNLRRSAAVIQERLAAVADWQVEVFELRHLENLSINEISHRMSRSNDAVRSSLYRMKRLMIEAVETGTSPVA